MSLPKLDTKRTDYPNLLDCEVRQMNPVETEAFFVITMKEKAQVDLLPNFEELFLFKILKARIEACSPKTRVNNYVLGFLALVSDRPGKVVMFAWMLHNWALKYNFEREITMETLGMEIIPNGLPTEEALHACWDDQKVDSGDIMGTDNALDYPYAWGLKPEAPQQSAAG